MSSSDEIKPEPTGLITSDSLAAESLSAGGDFAANNPHAAASQQPSASTTSNTTDTSGASVLPPAVDREARVGEEGWSEVREFDEGKGVRGQSGMEEREGAGERKREVDIGMGDEEDDVERYGAGAKVTGGYAGASDQARPSGSFHPHGSNLTEDPGLTGKTTFSEIGTENDPGRVAEQTYAQKDAVPGDAVGRPRDSAVDGENAFSGLEDVKDDMERSAGENEWSGEGEEGENRISSRGRDDAGAQPERESEAVESYTSTGATDQPLPPQPYRPHGTNITEDPDMSGKTAFGEVGTEMDPGRVAERENAKRDAVPGDAVGRARDSVLEGETRFGGLGDERV